MEWFRHDYFASNDLKIRKLLRNYGECAYGAYWLVVELLYQQGGSASAEEIDDTFGFMSSPNLKTILADSGLFKIAEDGSWSSARVTDELGYKEERREYFRAIGKKGGEAKANAKRTPSARQADAKRNPTTQPNHTKPVPDNTESSSYKNNSRLIRNNDDSCKLADTHKNASTSDEVPAAGSAGVAVTILSNKGEEVPIMENLVEIWEKAFPAVNVRAELQKIKSWSASNPTQRKTAQGMTRFCNNWLSKEQDRTRPSGTDRRFQPKDITGQHQALAPEVIEV